MQTRIVFMGTPPFAAHILGSLLAMGAPVVAVYSQPPRASGRGQNLQKSAVQLLAEAHNLPVETPASFRAKAERDRFQSYAPTVAIVAAYGLILSKTVLGIPEKGCLNVHGSLLPRWRGAAPVQYSILSGDATTGVTLMQMDPGMDTGPMLAHAVLPLQGTETTPPLMEALADLGAELLCQNLEAYLQGALLPCPQPKTGVTYAPKIEKSMGLLDFSQSAVVLERHVRALSPTWFFYRGARIRVLEALVLDSDCSFPSGQWGMILNPQLDMATSLGIFRPLLLQREGGKPLATQEFLRGFPMALETKVDSVHAPL